MGCRVEGAGRGGDMEGGNSDTGGRDRGEGGWGCRVGREGEREAIATREAGIEVGREGG